MQKKSESLFSGWSVLYNYYFIDYKKANCGAGTNCDCKINWLWVYSPLEEMKYLFKCTFPVLYPGVKVKCGVEFCHLTHNASRIQGKVRNGVC